MGLNEYKKKRDFKSTPEPKGGEGKKSKKLAFVIQKHQATRLHYDFRIELEGVLKSWAVPKGPSMVAGEKHLAVMVEDHPIDYAGFYGEIPEGNYGAGIVEIFDKGTYEPYQAPDGVDVEKHLLSQIDKGDLKIVVKGKYIKGAFALVKLKGSDNVNSSNWLIIKKKDKFALDDFDIESYRPVKSTGKTKKKKTNAESDFRKNIPSDKVWLAKKLDKDSDSDLYLENFSDNSKPKDEKEYQLNSDIKEQIVTFNNKKLKITNLNKVFWPEEGYTKGDLIKYYLEIHKYILPYLKDRPQSLNRFPNGIKGPSFYHKDMEVEQLPRWAKTVKIYSKANNREIDYLICNDLPSLLYMVNLGCIEINPWHSKYKKEEYPDYFILDLDPGDISFKEVVNTALVIKEISDELSINSYCKTSGATGLHIYFPLGARYDYDQVKMFAELLANLTQSRIPSVTTVERTVSKRGNKIYIDFLQNRKGQTIAAPYSIRPKPLATVSTPLYWKEVNYDLTPQMFTIENIKARLNKVGDLWTGILKNPVNISRVLNKIEKLK